MSIYVDLAIVFFISVAISALYTWLETPMHVADRFSDTAYKYLIFMATLLAFLLSFTITIVWQSYISINDIIFDQVEKLRKIFTSFRCLPDTKPILIKLDQYLTSIIDDQWENLKYNKINETTYLLGNELSSMIRDYRIKHPDFTHVLDITINIPHHLEELTHGKVNDFIIIGIMIVSIVFMGLLWFIRSPYHRVQFVFNAATIFVIGIALYFMVSLSRPFTSHAFKIEPDHYERLRNVIRAYLAQ